MAINVLFLFFPFTDSLKYNLVHFYETSLIIVIVLAILAITSVEFFFKQHLRIVCFLIVIGCLYKMIFECYRFAKTSNDVNMIIFLQYSVSSIILCVSVYELSNMKLFSPGFTAIVTYLACMSMQIFIFCFYGCEITYEVLIGWSLFLFYV